MRNLLLCMTPGIGLQTWERRGILDRELLPYHQYEMHGWAVTIATYDTQDRMSGLAQGMRTVRCWHERFLFLAPFFLWKAFREADAVKTNQAWRAWWYVFLARIAGTPILLRCGWVPGQFLESERGPTFFTRIYQCLEGLSFRYASLCQVTSASSQEWVISRYSLPRERVVVVPNFVDAELFSPRGEAAIPCARSVVAVGRLEPQKNFELLIAACALARVSKLVIFGDGTQRRHLERVAAASEVPLELKGTIGISELPAALSQYEVFAITSRYEGHPKALLEAMSCELPCVGTDVVGINDVIENGVTGLLAISEPGAFAQALEMCFADDKLRKRLGKSARNYVRMKLSLEATFASELRNIERIIGLSRASSTTSEN